MTGGLWVGASLTEYVAIFALLFAPPLALLICGLLAVRRVTPWLRTAGIALLCVGALVIVRQVLRTGVGDLMPEFAAPALVAAAVVYPLAAATLVRSAAAAPAADATPHGRRLASPEAASGLLIAAAVIQFAAPWLLTSGK